MDYFLKNENIKKINLKFKLLGLKAFHFRVKSDYRADSKDSHRNFGGEKALEFAEQQEKAAEIR